MPAKSPAAAVIVSVLSPNVVVLVVRVPDKFLILAPDELIALMSKLLLLITPLEAAILPEPDRDKPPALIVVEPL
jgi:hypothetical protein